MVISERVVRHLVRHGYLRQDRHAAPLALLLLSNVERLWIGEWRRLLRVPLVPIVPGNDSGSDLRSRHQVMRAHLDTVGCEFDLSPPYAVSLSTLHSSWSHPFLCPRQCSLQTPSPELSKREPSSSTAVKDKSNRVEEGEGSATSADRGGVQVDGVLPLPCPDFSVCARVPKAAAEKWLRVFQRQRRIWWRQLLRDPGDISLLQDHLPVSSSTSTECDPSAGSCSQNVAKITNIVFRGSLCMERLYVRDDVPEAQSNDIARAPMSLLSSHMSRDCCLWALAADGFYDQENDTNSPLHISARLAPYTHAVIGSGSQTGSLYMLATYISSKWCEAGVSVYPGSHVPLSPQSMARALQVVEPPEVDRVITGRVTADHTAAADTGDGWVDSSLNRFDAVGVLVTVLLDDNSLKSGVCRVRYRDTALTFESHVTHVVKLTSVQMGKAVPTQGQIPNTP